MAVFLQQIFKLRGFRACTDTNKVNQKLIGWISAVSEDKGMSSVFLCLDLSTGIHFIFGCCWSCQTLCGAEGGTHVKLSVSMKCLWVYNLRTHPVKKWCTCKLSRIMFNLESWVILQTWSLLVYVRIQDAVVSLLLEVYYCYNITIIITYCYISHRCEV